MGTRAQVTVYCMYSQCHCRVIQRTCDICKKEPRFELHIHSYHLEFFLSLPGKMWPPDPKLLFRYVFNVMWELQALFQLVNAYEAIINSVLILTIPISFFGPSIMIIADNSEKVLITAMEDDPISPCISQNMQKVTFSAAQKTSKIISALFSLTCGGGSQFFISVIRLITRAPTTSRLSYVNRWHSTCNLESALFVSWLVSPEAWELKKNRLAQHLSVGLQLHLQHPDSLHIGFGSCSATLTRFSYFPGGPLTLETSRRVKWKKN